MGSRSKKPWGSAAALLLLLIGWTEVTNAVAIHVSSPHTSPTRCVTGFGGSRSHPTRAGPGSAPCTGGAGGGAGTTGAAGAGGAAGQSRYDGRGRRGRRDRGSRRGHCEGLR